MKWGLKYWLIAFLLIIGIANAGEYTPDANTVALYHFNEGTGNFTADSGGSEFNSVGFGNSIKWAVGKFGSAIFLDPQMNPDTNSYVILPAGALNNLPEGTVEYWVYPVSPQVLDQPYTLSKMLDIFPNHHFTNSWKLPNQNISFKMNSNGTYGGLHSTDNSVPTDIWTHVAFVWNNTYHRIYINGVLNAVEEVPNVTVVDDLTHNIYLGAYEVGLGYNFRGYIDELRISNVARTSFNIAESPNVTMNLSKTSILLGDSLEINCSAVSSVGINNSSYIITVTDPVPNSSQFNTNYINFTNTGIPGTYSVDCSATDTLGQTTTSPISNFDVVIGAGGGGGFGSDATMPYIEDFAIDPIWTTNNVTNYYWDSPTQSYYYNALTNSQEYAYKHISNYDNKSFVLEFIINVTNRSGSGDINIGLFDQDMASNANAPFGNNSIYVMYGGYEDTIEIVSTDKDGILRSSNYTNNILQLNKLYHNTLIYNYDTNEITLNVTDSANGSQIYYESISNVGKYENMQYLGLSMVGSWIASGRNSIGYIDGVKFYKLNRAPIINTFSPTSMISVDEGSSLALTMNTSDPDGDALNYKWYIDNIEVSTTQNYTYNPDYNSQGTHNITSIISDSLLETSQYWNVTVNDITPPSSGGDGGGGGGGSSCEPSWKYENWGQCKDGKKYRKVIDENQCKDNYEEWLACTNETKEEIKEEKKEEIEQSKEGNSITGAAVSNLAKEDGKKGIGRYVSNFAHSIKETFVNIGQAVKNFVAKIKSVLWGK